MPIAAIAPVVLLALLTISTGIALGLTRYAEARSGAAKLKDIARLGRLAFSERNQQIAASYENQLEMPTLFYALVALALPLGRADAAFIGLEWLYVGLRFAHAYIHVTSNFVPLRFRAFGASAITLLAMWLYFAARLLL
jgi:hypothetical protein